MAVTGWQGVVISTVILRKSILTLGQQDKRDNSQITDDSPRWKKIFRAQEKGFAHAQDP